MYNRKKRWISGFLSFVMIMTMVLEILPPIKVGAAAGDEVEVEGVSYYSTYLLLEANIISVDENMPSYEYGFAWREVGTSEYTFEKKTQTYPIATTLQPSVQINYSELEKGTEYEFHFYIKNSDGTKVYSKNQDNFTMPYVAFECDDIDNCDSDGEVVYIGVDAPDNIKWTLSFESTGYGDNWIKYNTSSTTYSGTGSENNIKVTVKKNTGTTRSVKLKLYNSTYKITEYLYLYQNGQSYTPSLTVSESSLRFESAEGDKLTFVVEANEPWEVVDSPSWVDCSPNSKSISPGTDTTTTVTVTTKSANTSSSENSGTIYIESENCDAEIDIIQKGVAVPDEEERQPTITFKVSPTTVTEGEKITFSGMADGDGYKINAVSIGVAYYESEEKYNEEQNKADPSADDAVYLRKPEPNQPALNVDTFNYADLNGGSVLTGSDEPLKGVLNVDGEYVAYEILMRPGIYTFTAHAYSAEYGKEFEQVTKTVFVEPDEEIQEEIQLDSFPITNTETTVVQGSSYLLEWDAPDNAPDGTIYSIFVWGYSNTEVGSTTETYFEIPSECFENAEVVAITVYANANGYKQSECEETLNVTVIADDTKIPCVSSVVVSPKTGQLKTTYTFTAYAENTEKVVFYIGKGVGETKIGTATKSEGKFVYTYNAFKTAGTRTVYAYPIDQFGNEVRTEGNYGTDTFMIESKGTLENVKFGTKSYQTIDVGDSFKVEWSKQSNAPEDISYIVYVHQGTTQIGNEFEVNGTSKEIPSSYFTEEGRYEISVYAVADNWSQSGYSAITVYVKASVPTISGYRLSHTTIPMNASFTLKGTVDGNGDNLTEILVKAVNTSSGTSVELYSDSLNDSEFDLADIPALCPADRDLTEAGTYTISVYAKTVGAASATLLGKSSLYISADSKITLDTPQINGTSTLEYGENYIISWNYDSAVDYYSISVSGYHAKMTVNASEGSYSVPASIFKTMSSGSSYTCTIYVTAMSYDTSNYLPSATAEKKITVAGKGDAKAIIKSAEIVGLGTDKVVIGGTNVTFKVVTSTDVTTLRMKDGAGSFIINKWTTDYTDSGDNRIWTVTQKVNYAGGNDATGAKRMLTFYSMIGDIEYNTYNISFYCQKGDTIGTFSVLTPKNNSVQNEGKNLRITWSEPQNTEVDLYILDVVHNDQSVVREEIRGKCEYTLDGSYLVRDNNAWKIQITARKDAGQWSESSAYASFTLNCTHEKKNPSSERVLSYTNTGNGHRMEVEITSTCNGCGLEIVEDDPEIRTEEHKFVYLTEGGKVCNCCWYLVNDGTFTDTKEYIAKEKSYAYTNVRKDGTPYGVQYVNGNKKSIRTIFAGDKITIIGKLNGCCLVEYPISGGVSARSSGGYWYGFVKEGILGDIENKTDKKIILDGIEIENSMYSEHDGKYYCSLEKAIEVLGGTFEEDTEITTGYFNIEIPLDMYADGARYKAVLIMYDGKGDRLEGTNIYFYWHESNFDINADRRYVMWTKWYKGEPVIEIDEFATKIYGAQKISEVEYVTDYENKLNNLLKEVAWYFNGIAEFENNASWLDEMLAMGGALGTASYKIDNIKDGIDGALVDGDEIIRRLVMQYLAEEQEGFIDNVIGVYDWISTSKDSIEGILECSEGPGLTALVKELINCSDEDFKWKYSYIWKPEKTQDPNKIRKTTVELEKLIKDNELDDIKDSIDIEFCKAVRKMGEVYNNVGFVMNIISLLESAYDDTSINQYVWLQSISKAHYDRIIEGLEEMYGISEDARFKVSLKNMIDEFKTKNVMNAFDPINSVVDANRFIIKNSTDLYSVLDYTLRLCKKGIFGKEVQALAMKTSAELSKFADTTIANGAVSGKITVGSLIQGVVVVETALALPSSVAAVLGMDSEKFYKSCEQIETIGGVLENQASVYNELYEKGDITSDEFIQQLEYCIQLTTCALDLFVEACEAADTWWYDCEEEIREYKEHRSKFKAYVEEIYQILDKITN